MKYYFMARYLVLLLVIISYTKCTTPTPESENKPSQIVDNTISTTVNQKEKKEDAEEPTLYIVVVDKLRLRKEGTLKSEVVATLKEGSELQFTGNKTSYKDEIELRGETHKEPWLEMLTATGKKGWVFGGAVRELAPTITGVDKEYEIRRKQTLSQLKPSEAVKQVKQAYEITLANGQTKRYKDISTMASDENGDFEDLEYVGTFKNAPYHLFDFYSMEYWEMVLINTNTGKRTSIIGYPALSKDKKRFGIFNGDLRAGFTANGVQIFRIDGDVLIEEYNEEEPFKLEPSRLKWLDGTTIQVTLQDFSYDEGDTEVSKVENILLKREGTKWNITPLE